MGLFVRKGHADGKRKRKCRCGKEPGKSTSGKRVGTSGIERGDSRKKGKEGAGTRLWKGWGRADGKQVSHQGKEKIQCASLVWNNRDPCCRATIKDGPGGNVSCTAANQENTFLGVGGI